MSILVGTAIFGTVPGYSYGDVDISIIIYVVLAHWQNTSNKYYPSSKFKIKQAIKDWETWDIVYRITYAFDDCLLFLRKSVC